MVTKITKAQLELKLKKAEQRIAALESQRPAVNALMQTEINYHALFEQTHDAVFIMDFEGNVLAVNQRATDMLGYEAHELTERMVSNISTQPEQSRDVIKRLMNGEHIPLYERTFQKKDGSHILTEIDIDLVKDVNGVPLYIQSVARDITERKQAEDALKKSEAQYRLLADNMSDNVWLMDTELQVIYISPSTTKLQGYTLQELQAMSLEEQMTAESYERAMVLYTEGLSHINLSQPNSKHVYDIDLEFCKKDGTTYWSRNSFKIILDENGQPINILGIGYDITDRKLAEDALRISEERYRIITEDMPAMICRFLADGTITFVNSFYCNYFNTQYEKLVGSNLFLLVPESERDFVRNNYLSLDRKKPFITYEYKAFDAEGNDCWQRWTDRAIFNQRGEVVEYQSIGDDITERKYAEQQLAESAARIRALIANTGDLIVVIDVEGKISFASPSSEHIFGYTPEEAIGKSFLEWIHPDDLPGTLAAFQSRRQIPGVALESIKVRGLHRDGSWRFVETVGTNLLDDPSVKGIVLNIRDVTERQRTELEKQVIYEIMQGMAFSKDLGEFLGLVHYSIGRVIRADNFFVSLYNPSNGFFEDVYCVDAYDEPFEPSSREGTLTSYIFRTGSPLLATDEKFKELIAAGEVTLIGVDSKSWVGVPLKTAGKTIGVMVVQDYETVNLYSEKELSFLASISGQVASAVQRKQAETEISRQLSELETLYESGLAISRLLSPKEIAQKVIEILGRRMNWHHIAIRQYQPETNSVKLIGFHRPDIGGEEMNNFISRMNNMITHVGQGLSGWVTLNGVAVRAPNVKRDKRYVEISPEILSGIYVPLKIGERVTGSVAVESEVENAFTENDIRLLETLAGQAAIAIENANLFLMTQKEIMERQQAEAALHLQTEELLQLNDKLEQRVKERTAEIEVTRKRLELAADAAGLGIWEWDILTGNLIWDAQMYRIHDLAPEEFDGKIDTLLKSIHPEDQLILLGAAQEIMEQKETNLKVEHRIIRKSGEVRTIFEQGVAVFDERGLLERIIGIVNDVTPQKQAEQDLRESESYARLLFDSAPDPVTVAEVDGKMVDVNRLFEQQHDIKREDARNKYIEELNIFPSEQLVKAKGYIMDIVEGREVPPVELDFYNPGGGMHTLEMHSYPIEVKGKMLVLSTSRDITIHKKAEESLRIANTEMERALRMKDEFLANMSHELRTPLNAVLGMSESLEEQIAGPLNEKQLKYIRTIGESGRHLLELINDILDLSKIEAGRLELNISQVFVKGLCEASLRMVKEQAQKKNQRISLKIDPDVKVIMGDERRLKQSLVNLLSNAVKFTPNDREIGIEVTGNDRNQTVTFTVWDEGIGIAPEELNLIFKPFVQLDSGLAREFSGTGLGLVLVAQMIRLHGGSVSVESKKGMGSRFLLTLPWVDVEGVAAKVMPQKTAAGSTSLENRSRKILIVEDTDSIIMLLSEYLRYKGYQVIVARNGMEGVKLAIKEKPDLILMDVMMPVMDGVEATERIRMEKDLQQIPILALTALAMPGDKERCLKAGMNDYLSKPVQMKELESLILKYIHKINDQAAPLL